jgi:hypothetical protein
MQTIHPPKPTPHVTHDDHGKLLLVLFDTRLLHGESREQMLTTFLRRARSCCTLSSSRGIAAIVFLQWRLVSTAGKRFFPMMSQFLAPVMDPRVGNSSFTSDLRDRLPTGLCQPHRFLFELSRVDFLHFCHA